jgi:urate oxidase
MAIRLGENNYGKSRVRLLRVEHQGGRHDIKEMTLSIALEGDFETAHTIGDNRKILPTDTMKNTVYALAGQHPVESAEDFCLRLAEHFLGKNPQVSRVRIDASENLWTRIIFGGQPHATAFHRAGEERRTAHISATRSDTEVRAGIEGLVAMKTTGSAFEGFLRDRYTTLREDRKRILATSIHATWLYRGANVVFKQMWHSVRQQLLETFAEHESLSLQHTLYAMGEAVLSNCEPVSEIRLSLPNKHYNLVDLTPFGLDNPAEVFLPIDEPHGLIEATLHKE